MRCWSLIPARGSPVAEDAGLPGAPLATAEPEVQAQRLLRAAQDLLDENRQKKLLALVEAEWAAMQQREPCREDAETCRLAMVAAYQRAEDEVAKLAKNSRAELHRVDVYYEGLVWRMRCLARAAACNWVDGIMALIMSEALRVQSFANNTVRRPGAEGYEVREEALEILAEMEPFIGLAGAEGIYQPSPSFTGRQFHEKMAFLNASQGRWVDAITGFTKALDYVTEDRRGQIKVDLNLQQARYRGSTDPDVRTDAIERTQELGKLAVALEQLELAQKAFENVRRMEDGEEELVLYEVL